jgi:serine/threonine protein kinase
LAERGGSKDPDAEGESHDAFLREVARVDDAAVPAERVLGAKLGRFVLHEQLGRGGMGVVFRAEDETLRRTIALKVLPDTSGDEERTLRFLREARSAAALNHPNVAVVYDVGEAKGQVYLAM